MIKLRCASFVDCRLTLDLRTSTLSSLHLHYSNKAMMAPTKRRKTPDNSKEVARPSHLEQGATNDGLALDDRGRALEATKDKQIQQNKYSNFHFHCTSDVRLAPKLILELLLHTRV